MNVAYKDIGLRCHEDFIDRIKSYNKKVFIETGTCFGWTCFPLIDSNIDIIKSVEMSEERQIQNTEALKDIKDNHKVTLYTGKSSDKLEEMLCNVNEQAVIFLDAHPSGVGSAGYGELFTENGPLEWATNIIVLSELQIILSHHIKNHVIIIDDLTKKWIHEDITDIFNEYELYDKYNFFMTSDRINIRHDKMLFCEPK